MICQMSSIVAGIFFLISFAASTIGTICGIGGGVVIKPVLDMFDLLDVSVISFLSGCTVLGMSSYNVVCAQIKKESYIDLKLSTFLGIGAIIGGICGNQCFESVKTAVGNIRVVGEAQSMILLMVTIGTLIYTIKKDWIGEHHISSKSICILIGISLGCMSSFLGIGGGPINLVVLYFFFSMETKAAAQNSLYIIFLSQLANLVMTILRHNIPEFQPVLLAGMVGFGILGGIAGRKINKKIHEKAVERLFMSLMGIIILLCIYNFCNFAFGA